MGNSLSSAVSELATNDAILSGVKMAGDIGLLVQVLPYHKSLLFSCNCFWEIHTGSVFNQQWLHPEYNFNCRAWAWPVRM